MQPHAVEQLVMRVVFGFICDQYVFGRLGAFLNANNVFSLELYKPDHNGKNIVLYTLCKDGEVAENCTCRACPSGQEKKMQKKQKSGAAFVHRVGM